MTDKEILGTIYRWIRLANSRDENPDHTRQRLKDFQDYIEQEWQKQDEIEDTTFSKNWYTDARDMERHRGLEIGPDGTVTEVK
jgi:hypothetical protein